MAETKTTPVMKIKPNSQITPSKPKITDSSSLSKSLPSSNKMKAVTTVTKSEVNSKPTTISSSSSKTTTTTKTTKRKTTTTKVRERKVYSLPGQKHDPPQEKEPLRIFYESLSKQIPTSEMAEFWLMEHGLLSPERAKKALEKKQRKQKELRSRTPVKSSSKPPTKTASSQKPQPRPNNTGSTERPQPRPNNTGSTEKPQPRPNNTGSSQKPQQKSSNGDIKAKRKIDSDSDDEDDDDFILSHKRRRVL
ncbi:uncharacterized protein LOC131660073 isoform X2 [Vicia villosa]|uniref:uncharacterized protein LOC131660073 isoform X1 n=2 Tax=Vicia villosa TaxID=3911 RepID=UPI00273AD3BA|nr:uncharacterized protein LOC131660073 isoform X1 [Vicia villosa]XP_058785186.1 uncharacterized protein LOC131660073 isoform X2 [Vicia villosa]